MASRDVDEATPRDDSRMVRAPRWYTPSLVALALAGLVAYVVTGGEMNWWVVLAVIAGIVVIAILWLVQRAFNAGEASPRSEATYGSSVLSGLFWILLGIWQVLPPLNRHVLGAFVIAFGVLTMAAFGPTYIRERSRQKKARAAE